MAILLWYLFLGMLFVHVVEPIGLRLNPECEKYEKAVDEVNHGPWLNKVVNYLIAYVLWLPGLVIGLYIGLTSRDIFEANDRTEKLLDDDD